MEKHIGESPTATNYDTSTIPAWPMGPRELTVMFTAVLVTRVVEDTVHGIRYDKEPIEEERLISELADMLLLYLVR